ncbi:MAG: M15 family metallopeptidase [Pseudomonadota bacterium]
MSRDLRDLSAPFAAKVDALLTACRVQGVHMRPFYTLRAPAAQARLWRQSRSRAQVHAAIAGLREAGAPFLAHVLERVGPQTGRWATNALPGLSWHQWGEAVDCFWLVDGRAEWSTRKQVDGRNGYRVYADAAEAAGLAAGGRWRARDWPHVQMRADSSPLRTGMTLADVDAEMRARFG